MKLKRTCMMFAAVFTLMGAAAVNASALEYDFDGVEAPEYYGSTSYEDAYGAEYNYGGTNVVDYEIPQLPYGTISNTSIGTVSIPSLDIKYKVYEGETNASMSKGLGHYTSTSAWDGNVGVCGHNRGAKYVIGAIKDLEIGAIITYSTSLGTRTYAVETVATISSTDWSYLSATSDNRITITAERSTHKVFLNGSPVEVEAYLINGNNYYKLRDIAALVDFGVSWSGESQAVLIDTMVGYTPEGVKPSQPQQKPAVSSPGEDFSQKANPAIFTGARPPANSAAP